MARPTPHSPGFELAPGIDTPGFRFATPRSFQAWLALASHAQKFAHGDHAQDSGHGAGWAEWTVDCLARACGCNRNTAGNALRELAELGWIRTGLERHAGGQFSGFRYSLCPPPESLTEAAKRRQAEKRDGHQRKAAQSEARLLEEELRNAKDGREDLENRLKELYDRMAPPSIEERLKGKR